MTSEIMHIERFWKKRVQQCDPSDGTTTRAPLRRTFRDVTMDVETPNVSATTNDERTPLIDRTPRARVTKPAAWVWAVVMVTCLAGVIFLGVSGNLHQNMGVSGNNQDMGVSGNLDDAAAVHAAGDSSLLGGWRSAWNRVTETVSNVMQFDWEGEANKFKNAMNDAKADAASKANEIVQLKHQISDLTGVISAVKNMHTLSDLQNNAIIPPDIKNAVSTVVDSPYTA
jgi:hypothetical protein